MPYSERSTAYREASSSGARTKPGTNRAGRHRVCTAVGSMSRVRTRSISTISAAGDRPSASASSNVAGRTYWEMMRAPGLRPRSRAFSVKPAKVFGPSLSRCLVTNQPRWAAGSRRPASASSRSACRRMVRLTPSSSERDRSLGSRDPVAHLPLARSSASER